MRRLTVLASMICSCIKTQKSSLEGISRSEQDSSTQSESRITQAKRWISSKWTDWDTFFAPYIVKLLAKAAAKGQLILVMDGSETASGCVTLMLSAIWFGYALPLVWITREGKKGHFPEDVHIELIAMCQKILPSNCRIVLLGDGEFDGHRLREQCKGLKWEFVLRTSLDRKVDCGGELANLGDLCPQKGSQVVFIEDACQGDNAILWWGKKHETPIPLLTNMDLGQMACEYYRMRFKIETLFKQFKSAGFHVHKCQIEGAEKVRNLIIVIAMAFIFTFCIGLELKKKPKEIIKSFTRYDRVHKMMPITLAQKCIDSAFDVALNIFSIMSMNWDDFLKESS